MPSREKTTHRYDDLDKRLSEKVRAWMDVMGWSVPRLALAIGRNDSWCYTFLAGTRSINDLRVTIRLAHLLRLTVSEFIDESPLREQSERFDLDALSVECRRLTHDQVEAIFRVARSFPPTPAPIPAPHPVAPPSPAGPRPRPRPKKAR